MLPVQSRPPTSVQVEEALAASGSRPGRPGGLSTTPRPQGVTTRRSGHFEGRAENLSARSGDEVARKPRSTRVYRGVNSPLVRYPTDLVVDPSNFCVI